MDKFIILTGSEIVSWGTENVTNHLYAVGTDGTGIFGFTTVPASFNSKTVYNKSQVDSMFRDNTNAFYLEEY